MTQATISKKLNKTAIEMRDLIKESRRKLLELEVIMGLLEVRQGKVEKLKSVSRLFKELK